MCTYMAINETKHTTFGELSSHVSGTICALLPDTRSNLLSKGINGALVPDDVILEKRGSDEDTFFEL